MTLETLESKINNIPDHYGAKDDLIKALDLAKGYSWDFVLQTGYIEKLETLLNDYTRARLV